MRISNPTVRTLLAAVAVLLPRSLRRFVWGRLLGYRIDATAAVGCSFIDVGEFRAGPGAKVASLSILRGCARVELGQEALIGPFVWVNAVRLGHPDFFPGLDRDTSLVMGRAAAITSMHFLDCCDRIEMGEFSVISGLWTQLLAHAFSVERGELTVAPITLRPYSIIGTRSVVLPGTEVGAKTVVAAGSVLTGGNYEPQSLYAGVPAVRKRALDPEAAVFVRQNATVR